jgi:signal transduction histidine kinase
MANTPPGAGRLLVIDDEFGPRESLRFLFKDRYTVVCVDSVDAGIAELKRTPPDVIILDIKMPGKSGIEGLGEIREIDPLISVIMLTGFGNLETAQKAIRLGATDYIRKPFDTREMRETVERYIERTRLARTQARTTREAEELNTLLKDELAQAKHYASLGEASTEFVHDLRNPLTVISGYVQLLVQDLGDASSLGGKTPESMLEYLATIDRNVTRCYELSEMWRSLARRESLRMESLRVADLLAETAADAALQARGAGVTLTTRGGPDDPRVRGDRIQLGRALQNLVSNAIEAVPADDGAVTLGWSCAGAEVFMDVCDNGCGIPPAHLEQIARSHFTTKGSTGGLGVGLLVTRKAAAVHGGSLHLENRPEGGFRASLHLPLHPPDTSA